MKVGENGRDVSVDVLTFCFLYTAVYLNESAVCHHQPVYLRSCILLHEPRILFALENVLAAVPLSLIHI